MNFSRTFSVGTLLVAIFISPLFSQKMPFPQSKNFANCIKPTCVSQNLMNVHVAEFYEYWKAKYLKESTTTSGGYYVKSRGTGGTGNQLTVSEAHGFGMIITSLMAGYDPDAKKYFDGLYKFFDERKINTYLMNWSIGQDEWPESGSEGTATDGDLDIAYALILASYQWDNADYLEEAKNMISSGIKSYEVSSQTNRLTLGDWDDDGYQSRPSDWMTSHLHTYYDVTGDDSWNTVASTCYDLYETFATNHSSDTWLITDFIVGQSVDPCEPNFLGEYERTDSYNFNACRTPLRLVMDYGHYGTAESKNICDNILSWLKGATDNDPTKIAIGYELNGDPIVDLATSMAYTAPFIAACVVDEDHQAYLNKGWYAMHKDTFEIHQYEVAINLLSMLFISGNWWKPGDNSTPLDSPVVDTSGVLIDDFKDYYKDDPDQSYLGAAYGFTILGDPAAGGGYWYPYCDSLGSKVLSDGVEINDSNTAEMIKNSVLHVSMKTSGSTDEYPYAGVGCPLLKKGETFYDLNNLSGITIRLKGSGKIRIQFVTEDIIKQFTDENDQWGFYGFEIDLKNDWELYTVSTAYFAPERYSPAEEKMGWGWSDHGNPKVREILISVRDSCKDVELYIGSVFFNGLDYQGNFNFVPEITNTNFLPKVKTLNNMFSIKHNWSNKTVTLSYTIAKNRHVKINIFDTKGKMVAEPVNTKQNRGTYTHKLDFKSQVVSSGIYFVTFTADDKTYCKQLYSIK